VIPVSSGSKEADDLVATSAAWLTVDLAALVALAAQAGTNAYEIPTRLGARYRRRYLNP
jgi:hypothetical protein